MRSEIDGTLPESLNSTLTAEPADKVDPAGGETNVTSAVTTTQSVASEAHAEAKKRSNLMAAGTEEDVNKKDAEGDRCSSNSS